MKIAIMSLPLSYNYGGYLQCYALMETLRKMGHEVYFLQRENSVRPSVIKTFIYKCKLFLEKSGLGCLVYALEERTNSGLLYKTKNFRRFTNKYIRTCSNVCTSTKELKDFCEKHKINAFITGSDQIWRGTYCRSVNDAFLGFAPKNALKIAYAPSFGSDKWEYDAENTKFIEKQLNTFSAISVRENHGVELLLKHVVLNQTPKVVLDPTFLLSKQVYLNIARNVPKRQGLLTYILNASVVKEQAVQELCCQQGLAAFSIINPKTNTDEIKGAQGYSVEQWLAGFRDADYVITDSFHATVFSLIFNKPFWVLDNEQRGNSRLFSLLELFDCKDRFVDCEIVAQGFDWSKNIDWKPINKKKEFLIKESISFLIRALGDDKH